MFAHNLTQVTKRNIKISTADLEEIIPKSQSNGSNSLVFANCTLLCPMEQLTNILHKVIKMECIACDKVSDNLTYLFM